MKQAACTFVLVVLSFSISAQLRHVKIGERSAGNTGPSLSLVARIQGFNAHSANGQDIYDHLIYSPKSALILQRTVNGKAVKWLYVNNLEGRTTTVYDMGDTFKRIAVIRHIFRRRDSALFFGESGFPGYKFKPRRRFPNVFTGKPVEMCLSNNDRFLWVSYYRRDYDTLSQQPSAIAIIDVNSNKIVRVMPAAPLPKMIATSPGDKYVAVTNWGNNTVHLIDVSSGEPAQFHYVAHFVVGSKLGLNFTQKVNRDHDCGLCLRGTVFTPDNAYLFVGRMGGGGIAVFDIKNKKYLGTIFGTDNNVRHLTIHGDYLYLSSNTDGVVERTDWKYMLNYLTAMQGARSVRYPEWKKVFTGRGARTIAVTSDGCYLFATANNDCKISIVRTSDMTVMGQIEADPYPVGMTLDKSDHYLVVTAQGHKGIGGNSVMIFKVDRAVKSFASGKQPARQPGR